MQLPYHCAGSSFEASCSRSHAYLPAYRSTGPRAVQLVRTPVQRLVRVGARKDNDQEPDFITSLVGKLFGQKVLEDRKPGGLQRLSDEALQELYPATTTEFAAPVEGDDDTVATFIRPLLAKTQLEKRPLRLAYDANRDGWTAEAFHRGVDTFGAAVVLCTTAGGAVCGGYNPKGWIGLGDYRDSQAAFLFTWRDGDTSKLPVKLPKVGGAGLAVVDKSDTGPQFGPEGFAVLLSPGAPQSARCRLGAYYAKLPDNSRSLFSEGESDAKRGNCQAELMDMRVYVSEGDGEQWELDGILWKTQLDS